MIIYVILGIILAFLLTVVLRALLFNPKDTIVENSESIEFDGDRAVETLTELIKCKTVSYNDKSLEDNSEFEKLENLLPKLFPNVFKVMSFQKLPDRALLFKWEGKNSVAPAVLMSHYDVVPASEENWEKPAFEGIIEDGVLWGRGTLDTKVTMNAALSAAEHLIKKDFVPENDIYLAFSGGEEVNGHGAINIVNFFEANGITPAIVVDEGGGVVQNVFPGVKEPCALIGIAEKGMINVEYKTLSSGGHASAPKPKTPIGTISKACIRVEKHPFKSHLTKPVAEMFDTLGRHSTFPLKLIFANLWCFKWVLDIICRKTGGEMNALMRTTVAFTQMKGSQARNVIPSEAVMVSNLRLNPCDTVKSGIEYLRKTVKDESVTVTAIEGNNPSPISETNCEAWNRISSTVAETWAGSIVSPYLMVQCSDSRHYGKISDHVYRFSAMALTNEERATIHGHNERITLDAIKKSVEFYIRLILKS